MPRIATRSGWAVAMFCAAFVAALAPCTEPHAATARAPIAVAPNNAATATSPLPTRVTAARRQIGVTTVYDPAYVRLPYPNGDVPQDRGVCTDVVIRALRAEGLDLQRSVHEDMRANFAKYPQKWGLRGPDRNIDHRRVPNLQTWFARQGWSRTPTRNARDYRAGDLVTWMLPGNLPHIGIVGDRISPAGTPLIVHNIGRGTREEDILFAYPITGHYRPVLSR
jgi:uncharacterized protein YijF (DUF1287 family)